MSRFGHGRRGNQIMVDGAMRTRFILKRTWMWAIKKDLLLVTVVMVLGGTKRKKNIRIADPKFFC